MGRATQGVKLINIKGKDSIAAVAKVMKDDVEEVIVDEDGNCFIADSVATGAIASLSPIESQNEAGAGRFQRLLSENEPAPPLGSQADYPG